MEIKEHECLVKDEKLRQVRELIRNSPLAASRSNNSTPFKDRRGQREGKSKVSGVHTCTCRVELRTL